MVVSVIPLVVAFVLGAALSAGLVPLMRTLLIGSRGRRGTRLWATPTVDRWHDRPIPKTGGIAMWMAVVLTCAVLVAMADMRALWPLAVAVTLMTGVGLIDDLHPVRPATKFIQQVLIAGLFLLLVPTVRLTGWPVVDVLLAFLWIVGITNALNLLDNIDGLAAGVAAIAGLFFAMTLVVGGNPALVPLAVAVSAMVGVLVGFLFFNFHPASVFMGDSGSHLIGSFLAAATLLAAPGIQAKQLVPVATIPVVLLLIPIFDTAFVTMTRGLAGRSALIGGRDHTSHRLVALGIGEREAVLVLYVLAAIGGAVALALQGVPRSAGWGLVSGYMAIIVIVGLYLGHVHAKTPDEASTPPLPGELANRFRIYEVAVDAGVISLAYYASYSLRFGEPEFSHFLPYFVQSLPLVIVCQLGALALTGKYRQIWVRLGASEVVQLLQGVALGIAATVITVLYLYRFEGYSRTTFVYDGLLLAVFMVVTRVTLASLDDYLRHKRSRGRDAVIYGAGRGGTLAVRELLQNAELSLRPIGFVDDDPGKRRLRVDGIPVLGTLGELESLVDRRAGKGELVVVISIRDLSVARFEEVRRICESRNIEVRRMRFMLDEVRLSEPPAGVIRFGR